MKISAVVNVHDEGHRAWRSIRAVRRSLILAKEKGHEAELIVVADKADELTLRIAQEACKAVLVCEHGDLGSARNEGAEAASGDIVAFCDGDDIWGEDWLWRAAEFIERNGHAQNMILHPLLNVNFGADNSWWTHKDSGAPDFDPSTFFVTNHWTSLACARRDVFLAHPYMTASEAFGFEDWEWNTRTLSAGIRHAVVPQTMHFVRKSLTSMNAKAAGARKVIRPNDFFRKAPLVQRAEVAPRDLEGGWVTQQWRAAHEVEPELFPDPRHTMMCGQYVTPTAPHLARVYYLLAERLAAVNPTHLIIVPWLTGDPSIQISAYAKAINAAGGRAALLLTNTEAPLEAGVVGMPEFRGLEDANVAALIGRAVLTLQPKHVHVIDSVPGYAMLARYAKCLKELNISTWTSLFREERYADGRLGGFAFNGFFAEVANDVRGVLSDGYELLRLLRTVHGISADSFFAAPTPIALAPGAHNRVKEKGNQPLKPFVRVLWASRMDRQKNPKLLADVAAFAATHKLPIVFDVWGSPTVEPAYGGAQLTRLRELPNVSFRGPFGKFEQVKPEECDVFLYTGAWDGMPNEVLEAMAHGLPVVSTPSGELSRADELGMPIEIVRETDDPKHICAELLRAHQDFKEQALAQLHWLSETHTDADFFSALREAGYL